MSGRLAKGQTTGPAEREERVDANAPAVGRWFWVKGWGEDYGGADERLCCVTHVGSNFVNVRSAMGWERRVHNNAWEDSSRPESRPNEYLKARVEEHRTEVVQLMGRVQEVTRRLSVSVGPLPIGAGEPTGLAVRSADGRPLKDYKRALTKAKEKTLPELFKAIEKENEAMALWMKAALIPLKAEADALKPAIELIESRIFNVELYAGLVENVKLVREGKPAAMAEPIRLFQRRHYMDEECLLGYRHGGMTFKSIRAFDKWLVQEKNMERILPFQRCVVAFQVRRSDRDLGGLSLRDFISVVLGGELDADKWTFLYIRNGEQLYRLNTEINFEERLFPDMETVTRLAGAGQLYAKEVSNREWHIVPESAYLEMRRDDARKLREWRSAKESKRSHWRPTPESGTYAPFNQDNVKYDDILASMDKEMAKHNRLVLVLQGLLDRSPALLPHPPWQIWGRAGFEAALRLVYDDARALSPGEAPDFEAYRARLNASLAVGSITVGQELAWEQEEAMRENARRARNWRYKGQDRELKQHRPYGNSGPGLLAKVEALGKGGVLFRWKRERQTPVSYWKRGRDDEMLGCVLRVPAAKLLNVSAYKLGDYRQFFEDPRTRADYLRWAPLLLEAEEFHAGNRKVGEPG